MSNRYGTISAEFRVENTKEIDDILKQLNDKATSLKKDTDRYIKRMVKLGVEYAKNRAPIDTGDLREGIIGTIEGEEGVITSTSEHSAFVEFGTGVVGQGTYPGDTQGYAYNVPSMYKDETDGWWWKGRNGSVYTHGYKANPFMHDTAQYLKSIAVQTAKEILSDNSKRDIQPNKE